MGFFDKVKDRFGVEKEDEWDEEETGEIDEIYEEELPEIEEKPTKVSFQPAKATTSTSSEKKVNLSTIPRLKVILVKPERFDEASDIADNLADKKTVVLNLESCNKDVARRLVDFLSGVAYAFHGNVERIANSTFLITPYNVDISGIGLMSDYDTPEELY
jgi:cell division inhibitor SepF